MGTISSFASPSSVWDLQFRRNLTIQEVQEFLALSNVINHFRLSRSTPDSGIWSPSPSGSFSVSYFLSALSSPASEVPFPHKSIWFALAHSKVQAFFVESCLESCPYLKCPPIFSSPYFPQP